MILSEWAKRFRNAYCADEEIDDFCRSKGLSRKEYLLQEIFPDKEKNEVDSSSKLGPSTRSGDFAELLVSDFLEYRRGYWMPSRILYNSKPTKNSSIQGSDVVGLKFVNVDYSYNKDDVLIVCEVKAKFTGGGRHKRLQEAVNDSNKDPTRLGHFLNYAKRRFIREKMPEESKKIERFQSKLDMSYILKFGASAVLDDKCLDETAIAQTDCTNHGQKDNLVLLVFSGKDMMRLVHSLYARAADEA